MSDSMKKGMTSILHICATAAVAAFLAFIQNILQQKGVHCGPEIGPVATSGVGAALATAKLAATKTSII